MKTNLFTLLAAAIFMAACSAGDEPEPEKQIIPTDPSSAFVSGFAYEDLEWIQILTEGEYSVESANPEVATAELRKHNNRNPSVTIRFHSPGETAITIVDKNNLDRKTTFKCYGYGWPGTWHTTEISGVYFTTEYGQTIPSIANIHMREFRKELLEKTAKEVGDAYHFSSDGKLTVTTPDGTIYNGTYDWGVEQKTLLRLYYNGKEQRCFLNRWPHDESEVAPSLRLNLLETNYTEEYIKRYPNDKVTFVEVDKIIVSSTYKSWDKTTGNQW